MSKYGDSVRIKNKKKVVDYVVANGGKIGEFIEVAIEQRLQRELSDRSRPASPRNQQYTGNCKSL